MFSVHGKASNQKNDDLCCINLQMDVRTVYVGNLTVAADEKALRSIFDICGEVTQVRLAG
jgi:RNA recognition motif-containing protein